MPPVSKNEARTTLVVLGLMLIVSCALVWWSVRSEEHVPIDTRIETGKHLTFVFVAPTAVLDRGGSYVADVTKARDAMRQYASESGYYYSTIGISDHWSVGRGLEILRQFGAFDEIVVGRNAFNTGVDRFIVETGAIMAVPQVVVMLQERWLDEEPWIYGERRELIRVVGGRGMADWAERDFSIP